MIGPDTKIESILAMLDRIEKKRLKTGMSKTELYKAAQVTASAFSQWRSGTTIPKIETINRIAEVLNTSSIFLWAGMDIEKTATQEGSGDSKIIEFLMGLPKDVLRGILLGLGAPSDVLAELDQIKPQE